MDVELLERTLTERGEPAYRVRQVWEWTARGAPSYDDMTTLPKALRASASLDVL
jgi:23S rRNA (adenine2503-C2)-methyltransferase